jgi:hypothetical protein
VRIHPLGGSIKLASAAIAAAGALSGASTAFAAATPVACAGVRAPITPLGSNHLASLPKYDAIAPISGATKAVKSGAWSDAATWGGKKPTSRAFIPNGVSVVADEVSTPNLKSVRVEGCLELSNKTNNRLNAEFVYVAPKGELLAGTPSARVPATVVAEIVFPDLGPIDVNVDPTLTGKGVVATSRVRIYGAPKDSRVKVGAAPKAGSATIALSKAPAGWRVGDRIVITGTRFVPQKYKNGILVSAVTEDEVRFIKAISGSSLTLDSPLSFNHTTPDASVAAYVVNYTRNVRMATANGATIAKTQRGHSMFMSTETTIENAEFFEMGRTDKSIRAVDAATLSPPTPTSNVKGRYPVHLHQGGFPTDDVAPVLRGNAVWGSPGWGFAQHAGNAFLFQNNTWNTYGAGFVSESGNEIGAWVENTAVKGVGLNHLVKDGTDIKAFDLARTGDGFWMQSRSIRLHKNVVAGMNGGMGYVFFHRNNDLGSSLPLTPDFVQKALCMSPTMRFKPQSIEYPQIGGFTDNETFASEVGFHVVKSTPKEPHDVRSVIDGFKAWEVKDGVELTYTARYTVKNSLLIGSPLGYGGAGVNFGMNAYDLVVANSKIANFEVGVDLSKTLTQPFTTHMFHTLAAVTFSNVLKPLVNQDATDQILTTMPAQKTANVAFAWGAGPASMSGQGLYLYIAGKKSDMSGTLPYPVVTNEFLFNWTNLAGLTAERGWYTLTTGGRAAVVPEFYSDRISGETFQTTFIAKPAGNFSWPSKTKDGSSADKGSLDPKAAAPTAVNDAASVSANGAVTIAAFSNDKTNDGGMLPAGFTHAREGNVMQLPNGSFRYTPFPDFRGKDSFTYWIRNRQGVVSRATVTVAVN